MPEDKRAPVDGQSRPDETAAPEVLPEAAGPPPSGGPAAGHEAATAGRPQPAAESEQARRLVTYEDVKEAVVAIINDGREPTIKSVQFQLGRGSVGTIQPIHKQVMEEFRQVSSDAEEQLRPIVEAISRFGNICAVRASGGCAKVIARLQADVDGLARENRVVAAAKEAAETEVRELKEANAVLGGRLASAEDALRRSREQVDELQDDLTKRTFREQDWLDAKKELADVRKELAEAQIKAAKLEGRFEEIDRAARSPA